MFLMVGFMNKKYEIVIWKNKSKRDRGTPNYISPYLDATNIEAIKEEASEYSIEDTGCIEIRDIQEDIAVCHYENGKWTDLRENNNNMTQEMICILKNISDLCYQASNKVYDDDDKEKGTAKILSLCDNLSEAINDYINDYEKNYEDIELD
jgi:hypothetical protein